MNRLGKGFRVIAGIFVLLNIVVFFLPMTQSVRTNYPTKTWSQLQYVTEVMGEGEPYAVAYSAERMAWVIGLIVLPLLLSALAGIWGIVGDDRQNVSAVLSFIVLGLYTGLFMTVPSYYPNQSYGRASAGTANLICSGMAAVFSVLGIFRMVGRTDAEMAEIPQIQEMKQEQIENRYNIIESKPEEASAESPTADTEGVTLNMETLSDSMGQEAAKDVKGVKLPPYAGPPRGVIVGMTGMYAGAEIPFRDGEAIRLGRYQDNELIFDENQVKVSRNHCTIKWDGQNKEYLVYDTSTNGTFPDGSEDCLPKHLEVIVKPGTVLAIGDENNTFRLE